MPDQPEQPGTRDALDRFLYPISPYNGPFSPGALLFNANLQEFSGRIAFICALETGGNLGAEEAYAMIQALWEQFKPSQRLLESPPSA